MSNQYFIRNGANFFVGVWGDDASDAEDFEIRPTDNLILVGHVEGDASILEVYGMKRVRTGRNVSYLSPPFGIKKFALC